METYKTKGVCSRLIRFEIEDGRIMHVEFEDGCEGNLQAVARLVEGMSVKDAVKKLEGIDCDGRGTSCPDQLAKAVKEYIKRTGGND